jgi:hypothetical protein
MRFARSVRSRSIGALPAAATDRWAVLGLQVRDCSGVTDGLAVLAAWIMFGLLLLVLSVVVLRGGGDRR